MVYTREQYYNDILKVSDRIYIEEGIRIEVLEKAAKLHGLESKEKPSYMYIKDG